MHPLRIDFGYRRSPSGENSFRFEIDSSTPFTAFGYFWDFRFTNIFRYRPDVGEPFFFQNITGLSVHVPFRSTTFTIGFEEQLFLNQENPSEHHATYGEFQQGVFMTSMPYASWRIPTGLSVSRYGEVAYTPHVSTTFIHELQGFPLPDFRKGPFLDFGHSIGFGRVDWVGNFRNGLSVSVGNSYRYRLMEHAALPNDERFFPSLSATATGHFAIADFFAISTRLMYRHWFLDYHRHGSAADAVRGFHDGVFSANYMLSLNMDFPVRVVTFKPSRWYDNRRLALFDFEAHLSPVLDFAFFDGFMSGKEQHFNFRNMSVSGGLEFIVFPDFIRNLYLRLGIAANLRELFNIRYIPSGTNREIYLIMGHFY
jgi:hypothetical protein